MPHVAKDVSFIMALYSRCRANGSLPYAGGVLEQPAWIMDLFEVVDDVKSAHKNKEPEPDT